MRNTIVVATLVLPSLFCVGCGTKGLSSRNVTDASSDLSGTPDIAPDIGGKDSELIETSLADTAPDIGGKDSGLIEALSADVPPAPDIVDYPPDTPATTPLVYAMSASLSQVDGGYPGPGTLPPSLGFSMLVDWNGNTATTGANGSAKQIALRQTGDNDWEATEPLAFNLGLSTFPSMSYSTLKLTRGKDGCSAIATGTYNQSGGDVIYTSNIKSTITGIPDRDGPRFTVVPAGEVHPLAFKGITVNELLPAGTTASLTATGASLALTASPANSALGVSAFSLPDQGLAFGSTYKLRAQPDAIDLAGNKTADLPSFTTLADPGLLVQDGFEGSVHAYTLGFSATTSSTVLPIPAGTKALTVGPSFCSSRFTARLAVETGATSVKFAFITYKPKSSFGGSSYAYSFTVAAPNGAAVSTYDFNLKTTPLPKPWTGDPPGSDVNTYSDLLEAQLSLPTGTSSEVLFDVLGLCQQPGPPPPGLIIDNLRVE